MGFLQSEAAQHEGKVRRSSKSELQKRIRQLEKRDARINILPLLQAEEDRRYSRKWPFNEWQSYLRMEAHVHKKEAEIMKDVPGWKVGESTIKSRWVSPFCNRSTPEVPFSILRDK